MASNNIDAEISQLKSDVANLRKDMSELVDALKDAGTEKGHEYYDRAYQQAQNAGEYARERAAEAYGTFGKEVEERPLTSVLTAFGTGFVVGLLLDRRHH
jgi:ElaB/YqjD/DUF883 family membrane-anchored ribosome-binding protein